jgi:hypothetical protein
MEGTCSMTHAPTEHPADPEGYKLKKKPIYARVWFWLLAIILLIILISAVSGGGGNDASGGSVSSDAAEDAATVSAHLSSPARRAHLF